jgi:hypothetical protein
MIYEIRQCKRLGTPINVSWTKEMNLLVFSVVIYDGYSRPCHKQEHSDAVRHSSTFNLILVDPF